jgi:hypothetical protein
MVAGVASAQLAPGIYIPDSSAFSATNPGKRTLFYNQTGVFQSNFIGPNNTNLNTPVQAVATADGNGLLITDQIADNIQRYDASGAFQGVWASGLDNVRGITRAADGFYYAAVAGSTANGGSRIEKFDFSGNSLGAATTNVVSPWGITQLRNGDFLVSSSNATSTATVRRFSSNWIFLGDFVTDYRFTQQIVEARNGNIIIAVFSLNGPGGTGVFEFSPTGIPLFKYDMDGARGVTELADGRLLATAGTNIRLFDRFVATGVDVAGLNGGTASSSFRMIYNHPVPEPGILAALGLGAAALARRRAKKSSK